MITRYAFATLAALMAGAAPSLADVIKSEDGVVELNVPNGWRQTKAAAAAIQLQVTNGRAAVLVRASSREDFRDLKAFAQRGADRFVKSFVDADPKFEDVQVNGKPAIRVSIEGTLANGTRRGYLMTFLDTDGMFVNVTGIANASAFKTEQQSIMDIAGQVKILQAAGAAPAAATPAAGTPAAMTPAATPPAGTTPAAGSVTPGRQRPSR